MHREILTKEQIKLLPILKKFSKNFGLVGGTAVAFYIGHRESIDFDLFSLKEFDNLSVKRKISETHKIETIVVNKLDEFTLFICGVKITFFHYPYPIEFSIVFEDSIHMPDLLTLAAMKAYALGRRAKWRDYVDLYFIMKGFHAIGEIIKKAKEIFGNEFNEKTFRVQLSYFHDIDYSEKIIYLKEYEIDDEIIKKELTNFSLT